MVNSTDLIRDAMDAECLPRCLAILVWQQRCGMDQQSAPGGKSGKVLSALPAVENAADLAKLTDGVTPFWWTV